MNNIKEDSDDIRAENNSTGPNSTDSSDSKGDPMAHTLIRVLQTLSHLSEHFTIIHT